MVVQTPWPGVLVLAAACSFDTGSGATGSERDAAALADARVRPDAEAAGGDAGLPAPECPFVFIDGCDLDGMRGDLLIPTDRTIDTDTDSRCRTYLQPGGPDACLLHVRALVVAEGATLRAVGSRPLVIVAELSIELRGIVDVASSRDQTPGAGANAPGCELGAPPENDAGGAAGGAGGSFGGAGGAGGVGDTDSSIGVDGTAAPGEPGPAQATPVVVRGGCPAGAGGDEGAGGVGGAGGASGGGVVFAARGRIELAATGVVRAGGAGGGGGAVQSGGGGGGSGGMIGFESPAIVLDGTVAANGGGGGGGGLRVASAPTSGGPGSDGVDSASIAPGGPGAAPLGGAGGGGGALPAVTGVPGADSRGGAGGGGGAAGVVYIIGASSGAGVVSPPAGSPPRNRGSGQ